MPDGNGVIAGDSAGKWVRDSRQRDHENAEQGRAKGNDDPRRVPGRGEHHGEKRCHEEDVVTGKEHVAHGREAGEQ